MGENGGGRGGFCWYRKDGKILIVGKSEAEEKGDFFVLLLK